MKRIVALVLCGLLGLALLGCEISVDGLLSVVPTGSAETTEASASVENTEVTKLPQSSEATEPPETDTKPADSHTHVFSEWKITQEPTCAKDGLKARTCSCGERDLELIDAFPHTFQITDCKSGRSCTVCKFTDSTLLEHQWNAATCETPKACTVCGKTEGKATGHAFRITTCETPKACIVCGKTKEKAPGHNFSWATCTEPKKCRTCGITEGTATGHYWRYDYATNLMTCTLCKTSKEHEHEFVDGYCTGCYRVDTSDVPISGFRWICYTVDGNVIDQWGLEFFSGDSATEGRITVTGGKNIKILKPEQYAEGNVVEFEGERYMLMGGDDEPMTYAISGNTVTVTSHYSGTVMKLEKIGANKLKLVSITGAWRIPTDAILTPDLSVTYLP